MFSGTVKSDVSSFLEKTRTERDLRRGERSKCASAIIIQKWYRGYRARSTLKANMRTAFMSYIGEKVGEDTPSPTLKPAIEMQKELKKIRYKFILLSDRPYFEVLCRYLVASFEAEDKLSYLSLTMRKDCVVRWITNTKWILLQATKYLALLDPCNPRDSRLMNLLLSLIVILTNPSRWKVLKSPVGERLVPGMTQMTSTLVTYLVQQSLFQSLKSLLIKGLSKTKPALTQLSLSGILFIAVKPLTQSSFSPDMLALFALHILSVPGLILHMNTLANESFVSILNERLCGKTITYLIDSPQNQKILFNGLEGCYALCLIANLIQLGLLEVEVLADQCVQYSVVLSLLLDRLGAYVVRKKSHLTNWHPILGWFAQPIDKNLQASMCHVTCQLQQLWSSRMVRSLFTSLYELSSLAKPLAGQEGSGIPIPSKEKKKLFASSSNSAAANPPRLSLFKFAKGRSAGSTSDAASRKPLVPIPKSVEAASMLFCFAIGSLKEIRNDILAGLSFGDLLARMWRLIAQWGSSRDWARLIIQPGSGWQLDPNPSHLLHVFAASTANLLIILDDVELFGKQKVFTMEELLAMSQFFNEMIYYAVIQVADASYLPYLLQQSPLSANLPVTSFAVSSQPSTSSKSSAPPPPPPAAPPSSSGATANCPYPTLFAVCHRLITVLYDRDTRRQFAPDGFWLIKDLKISSFMADLHKEKPQANFLLKNLPHIIPHKERVVLFRELVKADKASLGIQPRCNWMVEEGPIATMITVNRQRIVEDGYQQLAALLPVQLKMKIRVRFVNAMGMDEVGIDLDGVFKEFLEETLRRVFDPGLNLFRVTTEQKLYPSPSSHIQETHLQLFEFLGRILGKAVYEGIVVDVPFANFFLTQMLGKEKNGCYSFIDELFTLDQDLYKSLTYIKHYEDDVSDLELTFSYDEDVLGQIITHDLVSGGRYLTVTNENKISYVHRVAHFRMYKQIRPQARAFIRGFYSLISPDWLAIFSPPELQKLISGDTAEIDIDDLKLNTRYSGGFHSNHRVTNWLWEVLKNDFTDKERSLFLKFVTSCSKAPLLGFSYLEPPFSIRCVQYSNEDQDIGDTVGSVLKGFFHLGGKKEEVARLPTASTCFNLLKLPNYSSRSTLRDKLRYAITSNAGFELS